MLAHDYSAASGHSDVTRGLRQFRDNFVIGRGLGGSVTREREQKYQHVERFLHGRLPEVEVMLVTSIYAIEEGKFNGVFSCRYYPAEYRALQIELASFKT
jgi:hypothetical protein